MNFGDLTSWLNGKQGLVIVLIFLGGIMSMYTFSGYCVALPPQTSAVDLSQTTSNVPILNGGATLSAEGLSRLREIYLLGVEQTVLNAWYQESDCFNDGHCWPPNDEAMTMVGRRRLANVRMALDDVIDNNVPGDFVETGAWKGGSCFMALSVLISRGVFDRKVWVCDSFKGIPKTDTTTYPSDNNPLSASGHTFSILNKNSLAAVKSSFAKAGLLNDQIKFLEGYFKDTLPTAPIQTVAVLRLDGDIYQSTWEGFFYLYPKLSLNGYVIIDDYTDWEPCRQATHDYRAKYKITDPIIEVIHLPGEEKRGVYWKKTAEGGGSGF
mmetsp:Transcript_26776/g.43730  ORF Transcript_26776/g.43730 Transcript_26776/m.43730 type:complete len:324 (+) Transcript_26776:125-1096(+)|eukprot:CAMPEP_0184646614 /NCGR_PEP_ID=MMETSP0308-20130426/3349_1 /TAXON_ID=38269 /ORGANISM="Gloeochaete witrockiana, Strain SAG 46.84" /LENGTH=323 /DNA_ID=CAMNT_0027076799 /DNA_START=61 /DNA_END=1032 /DNA_ORIENTATION=+